jgi:hypothetical protein
MSGGHSVFFNLGANLPAGRQVVQAFLLALFPLLVLPRSFGGNTVKCEAFTEHLLKISVK